jgi:hypothetical protein
MRRHARASVAILAVVGIVTTARNAIAQTLVTFQVPHLVRAPAATVDLALGQRIDMQAAAAKMTTPDDLVAFALRTTASALHFGLQHRTRLSFDGAEREGNCVEYAELFASIVNREHGNVDARAWVVRSDAKVLGTTMPDAAWKDHDWVLVVARTSEGAHRLYVDPTLYDMGLGWDISRAVRGDVRLP